MSNEKVYLVYDSASDGYWSPFGIYNSYELAIEAMKSYVAAKGDVEYLHCYEIIINSPVLPADNDVAGYVQGEWSL